MQSNKLETFFAPNLINIKEIRHLYFVSNVFKASEMPTQVSILCRRSDVKAFYFIQRLKIMFDLI